VKPPTLRTTLTLSYTAILALLLTALGFVYYRALAHQLDADATSELGEVTSGMHRYLRFDHGEPRLDYDPNDPDQVEFVEQTARYYQVYEAGTGKLLLRAPAFGSLAPDYTAGEVRAFREQPRAQDILTEQGRIRISNSLLTPGPGETYLLQVGVRLDAIDTALERFLRLLLWSVPACLIVAALAGRWMAGRALAPLARLATASRAIDVTALGRRLPVRGAGDELDAVAHAFNDTLSRLEQSVGDMKQFSAALAHELRTPLAALRGEAELALMQARSPDDYRRGLASQLEEMDRLSRLITQLLTLARAEAGEIRLARDRVDLGALTAAIVQSLDPVAQARGVTLSHRVDGDTHVTGDAGWLERLILNLVDNAIKFTPRDGQVAVRVGGSGGSVSLEVQDSGIGIAAEALPRIFDRFYQADPSRTSDEEGAGLGLSLARWIAQRHHATIDVRSEPGHGSTFTVRFSENAEGFAPAHPPTRSLAGPR
jgi:heavy metal sensor kinase